jgi:hypothetical protein
MRAIFSLVAIIAVAVNGLMAQAPAPRAFLLLVDDLHLDFRNTPRTRQLMKDVFGRLARDGDVWAVATTGTSSISIPPTTDLAALQGAVMRVTGNALKPSERVAPLGPNAAAEPQHRADISFSTAAAALDRLAAKAPGASLTVLYISEGYDTRRITGLQTVVDAASRARATVFVIKPWIVIEALSAGVPDTEWRAYLEATEASLQTLARETGGVAVVSQDDLEPALQRLTAQ